MRLYIMRHGQASNRAASDAQRPLTAHGQAQARLQAERFKPAWLGLAAVYQSPLVRARQTAEQLAAVLEGSLPAAQTVDWLVPEAPEQTALDALLACQQDVLLVSHQPLVSQLVASLAGQQAWSLAMDTASVALLTGDVIARGAMTLEAIYDAR